MYEEKVDDEGELADDEEEEDDDSSNVDNEMTKEGVDEGEGEENDDDEEEEEVLKIPILKVTFIKDGQTINNFKQRYVGARNRMTVYFPFLEYQYYIFKILM